MEASRCEWARPSSRLQVAYSAALVAQAAGVGAEALMLPMWALDVLLALSVLAILVAAQVAFNRLTGKPGCWAWGSGGTDG